MVNYPAVNRVECLNEIRPGKICGAHLAPGKTFCPVCGEKTTTRRIDSLYDLVHEPQMRSSWATQ
jgi:hypothetical protein